MDPIRMRDWRKWSGLTQIEIAKELGVDKQTVCRWETGKAKIRNKSANMFLALMNDSKLVQYIKDGRKRWSKKICNRKTISEGGLRMDNHNWQWHVTKAASYKELGQKEIYLGHCNDIEDYPWQFVVDCKEGGSHRLDIYTDVWFTASHPCGLSFRWSFDIEPWNSNGSGKYCIDVERIKKALALLPAKAILRFRDYLSSCVVAVRKKAEEYRKVAVEQEAFAEFLASVARHRG